MAINHTTFWRMYDEQLHTFVSRLQITFMLKKNFFFGKPKCIIAKYTRTK